MENNKKNKKQLSIKVSTIGFIIVLILVLVNLFYQSELPIIAQLRNSEKAIEDARATDAVDDEILPAGEIKYISSTIFKYDTDAFNQLTYNLEGRWHNDQGMYFNNGATTTEIGGTTVNNRGYNIWTKNAAEIGNQNKPYTGLVESEFDGDGNIVFTHPEAGIFDATTTEGKEIYTNVGIPFYSLGDGTYRIDSDIEDINFPNGRAASNTNLVRNENKNTYRGDGGTWKGFFPFNYYNNQEAVYHFGLKTDINFYMTSDGKTQGENKEDIIFQFTGDDDLWIFIDGKLVIDLGGIHDPISAEINFATKEVNTYLGKKSGGVIGKTESLDDLLGTDLGDNATVEHTLSIFYLERGGGSANCAIQYNLPQIVRDANVTVHHYLEDTETSIAPDELYKMEIGDYYETSPAQNLDEKYELVETPVNANGTAIESEVVVTYYYRIKTYDITTRVDGIGGTISGAGQTPYEKVVHGENSKYPIVITPDEGYIIKSIKINDEDIEFEPELDGSYTLDAFLNVKENKEIVVTFENTIGKVDVNHYLYTKDDGLTDLTIADTEHLKGTIGEDYETSPKTDLEYVLITNEEYYNAKGEPLPDNVVGTDSYIPENSTGTYEDGEAQVVTYYYKVKTYTVTVHHYIYGTEQRVPLKDGNDGEVVEDELIEGLVKNERYTTNEASEDKIDYNVYELVDETDNTQGYIQDNTEVIYYYKVKTASLTITKVAEEDYDEVLPDTRFRLYKLVDKNSDEKDELINKNNPQDCWELVGNYTTSATGEMNLQDLPINEEYRLVETKAAGNRLIPEGQWKIEFIYGDYDENDNTIVTVNGTKIRITAIGNPPALAETDSGELLLPNKKMFVFPSSGSLGTKEIYEIGLGIMIAGGIFLITRKALVTIGNNRKEKGLKPLVKIKTKHNKKQK